MNLLEQPLLRVRAADAKGRRQLDDEFGESVGVVYCQSGWCRWTDVLAVHEAFEEPIVFRITRQWSLWKRWSVVDAEGETIGTVSRAYVLDRWDRVLFQRVDCGRQFVAGGLLAAEWHEEGDSGSLVFHSAVRDEPFSKMLLLAAVLVD